MAINPLSVKGLLGIGGSLPSRAHFVPIEDDPATTDDRACSPPSEAQRDREGLADQDATTRG